MNYSPTQVYPYSIWHHVKTNSLYVVLGVATQSTNGPGEHKNKAVVYWSLSHGQICYCDLDEFTDGRFQPVTPAMWESLHVPTKPQHCNYENDTGGLILRCMLNARHSGDHIYPEPKPYHGTEKPAIREMCDRQLNGYKCRRGKGHDGPCAMLPPITSLRQESVHTVAKHGDKVCPKNMQGQPCILKEGHPEECVITDFVGEAPAVGQRCQRWSKGALGRIEQCCKEEGHEGNCQWAGGD